MRFNRTSNRFRYLTEQRASTMIGKLLWKLVTTMQAQGMSFETMTDVFQEEASFVAMKVNRETQAQAAKWLQCHRNTFKRILERKMERMEQK